MTLGEMIARGAEIGAGVFAGFSVFSVCLVIVTNGLVAFGELFKGGDDDDDVSGK